MFLRNSFSLKFKNFKNLQKKNFFSLNLFANSKSIENKETDLILHPEMTIVVDESVSFEKKFEKNFEKNEEKVKIVFDDNFDFIKLDSNGMIYININKGIPVLKENYYELLGVNNESSYKEIRLNYLKIAKKYHPDRNPECLVIFYHK